VSDAQRPRTAERRRAAALAGALAAAVAAAAPRAAQACYVCMSGREDETGTAFLLGSVALSLLPFATFGGIGVYLWRRVRAAERARAGAERGPAGA
jgi:hypothetical protein